MNNVERVRLANEERFKELAGFQQAAKSPDGQRVMEHLRRVTGADKSSYRPGDATATAFACGLRDAYLLMKRDAEIDVSELAEKLKPKEESNNV